MKFAPDQLATALRMAREAVPDHLSACVVGSARICGEGNDIDVLVLIEGSVARLVPAGTESITWEAGGSGGNGADLWMSWRVKVGLHCGLPLNLIVVDDREYYDKWVAACELCKFLHQAQQAGLSEKAIRVGVHCMVMDAFDAAKALAYAATVGPAPEVSSTQVLDAGVPMEAVVEHE